MQPPPPTQSALARDQGQEGQQQLEGQGKLACWQAPDPSPTSTSISTSLLQPPHRAPSQPPHLPAHQSALKTHTTSTAMDTASTLPIVVTQTLLHLNLKMATYMTARALLLGPLPNTPAALQCAIPPQGPHSSSSQTHVSSTSAPSCPSLFLSPPSTRFKHTAPPHPTAAPKAHSMHTRTMPPPASLPRPLPALLQDVPQGLQGPMGVGPGSCPLLVLPTWGGSGWMCRLMSSPSALPTAPHSLLAPAPGTACMSA